MNTKLLMTKLSFAQGELWTECPKFSLSNLSTQQKTFILCKITFNTA